MNRIEIGKRLIALRGNLTQEQVAKALGVCTSAIGMYERGERMPRDEIKTEIAKLYDTTVQEIFFAD